MSNPSKKKQLAVDTVLFGLSTFGSKILVFLLTPLYTAVLMTEEYGVADLLNTTVHLIYPVLTLAITDATLRYSLDKNYSAKAVLGNSVLVTTCSVIMLMSLYPIVSSIKSEIAVQISNLWPYFLAMYIAYNFNLCFSNFIKGIGKTKLFAIQGIVHTITVIVCNIYFLLIAKTGVQGYLLSNIIGFAVPTILVFFAGELSKYIIPFKLDKNLLKEMLKYSIPMIPTLLAWSINMYINKYMLIGLLPAGDGLSASGIFSVANKIPSLLTAVLSIFLQAWQLSAITNMNDSDESSFYTKVYGALDIVSLMGCLLIIPISKTASTILFDPDYYSAWQYIPFLTLSAYFSCLSGFLASAFRAYKKTGQLFVSVALGAVFNVILNIVLIKIIGPLGAAIATAVSFMITWIVRMVTIQRLVAVKINLLKTIITYFLMIFSCCLISFDFPHANMYYIVFSIIILVLNLKDIMCIISSILGFAKNKLRR